MSLRPLLSLLFLALGGAATSAPIAIAIHGGAGTIERSELDKDKATLVTCQSGLRAHIATRILKQSGFDDVKNLTGGMMMQQRVCPSELIPKK